MKSKYKRTKFACYAAYFTMSSVFSLPPILFMTLRDMYGISYTLLGTLVLVNFCTQMAVDLIFTVFSKYFPVRTVVRIMPLITSLGLFIYALVPMLLPEYAYIGLVSGTVIFSVSAGLSEVLLSPTIAAIPSKNPQRDMSLLHSLYAFGVFTVVIISTLFLRIFGTHNWMYLTWFFALLPIIAAVLFMVSPIPEMNQEPGPAGFVGLRRRTIGMALCMACIFFGSCAENVMSNWISGFMESTLQIDKMIGDVLGMAVFAILLGLTRIGYAKFGKNIFRTLLFGMLGAVACYLIVGLSSHAIAVFLACVLIGVFTAMLWPGTLILMEEHIPNVSVAAFALMAAAGDLGASIAPQLIGIVADATDLKTGMLVCAMFPILGVVSLLVARQYFKKEVPQPSVADKNANGKRLSADPCCDTIENKGVDQHETGNRTTLI